MMRFKVYPYQYVGEGNPDKDGNPDKNVGTCKQCVRLVILIVVSNENRWHKAELTEIKLFAEATKDLCVWGGQKIG